MCNEDLSRNLARELLTIGAVTLSPDDPFTWASGLYSPIYCDNRLTLGYPGVRGLICEGFRSIIERNSLACEVIAGTATAGIPHAAWLADRLNIPLVYVRGASKSHGKERRIEGVLNPGKSVVIIEDLVSTGMSSTAVIPPLENAGSKVSAVLAIFSYGLKKAADAFERVDTPLFTLTNFPALLDVARQENMIGEAHLNSLKEWYNDPRGWSDRFSG